MTAELYKGETMPGAGPSLFFVLIMMFAAFMQNSLYSLESRAGNRNSVVYYALMMVASSFAFYYTVSMLVSKNMTLILWVPYTVATVAGSIWGAKLSMSIESLFGITTRVDKQAKAPATAKAVLLVILAALIVLTILNTKKTPVEILALTGLAFAKTASFTAVRRSRNTNNAVYHSLISVVDGVLWYFMWRELFVGKLSLALFPPYLFGNILGGMAGQKISMGIEKLIGASADSHLEGKKMVSPLIPAGLLVLLGLAFTVGMHNFSIAWPLMLLALSQNISFAFISRARSRNNFIYHAIASIFSNGVWYATFRYVTREQMPLTLLAPYVAFTVTGSLVGVTVSMAIEKWLHITSDSHVVEKAVPKTA